MYEVFFAELGKQVALTEADKSLCMNAFEPLVLTKSSVLEEENKTPMHLYFVLKGLLKLGYYNEAGEEHTSLLAGPLSFVTSFLPFIHRKASAESLANIGACELLRVNAEKLVRLIDESEPFKRFSLVIFEHAIAKTNERAKDLASLSAEQRYAKLLNEQPEIVKQAPVKVIASYLGIKPESLSRIRKQRIP